MRILITGVAGFIGSNLADRLIQEDGFEIVGIDNLSYGVIEQVPSKVKFYKKDIRSTEIYPLSPFELRPNEVSPLQAGEFRHAEVGPSPSGKFRSAEVGAALAQEIHMSEVDSTVV